MMKIVGRGNIFIQKIGRRVVWVEKRFSRLRIESTTPRGEALRLCVTLLGLVVIIIFLSVLIETEYSISTNNHRRKSFSKKHTCVSRICIV